MDEYQQFIEMIDKFVLSIKNDPELESGIRWLDEQSRIRGISFYDMVFEALYREDIKEWFNNTR